MHKMAQHWWCSFLFFLLFLGKKGKFVVRLSSSMLIFFHYIFLFWSRINDYGSRLAGEEYFSNSYPSLLCWIFLRFMDFVMILGELVIMFCICWTFVYWMGGLFICILYWLCASVLVILFWEDNINDMKKLPYTILFAKSCCVMNMILWIKQKWSRTNWLVSFLFLTI